MAEAHRNDLTIYDAAAARWWTEPPRWVRALRNLVPARLAWFDRFVDWPGRHVLDLGCAGGFMAEALDRRGAVVTGIDPARAAVAAAAAHAAQEERAIGYVVARGEALPFADASFDLAVCVDVLEHVDDLGQVLGQAARVLRPGGVFLFDTINRNALARLVTITLAEDMLGLLPRGTHDPGRFVRPSELRDALRVVGLAPGPFTGLGPRGLDRHGAITFGRLPFSAILFMGVARKAPDPASAGTSRSDAAAAGTLPRASATCRAG